MMRNKVSWKGGGSADEGWGKAEHSKEPKIKVAGKKGENGKKDSQSER